MTTEAWVAKKRQLIELNKKSDVKVKEVKTLGLKRTNTVPKVLAPARAPPLGLELWIPAAPAKVLDRGRS